MKREIIKQLEEWRNNKNRKPLILSGARQVGKTWVLKEFGHLYFKNVAYINFEEQKELYNLFKDDYNLTRILITLNTASQITITPGETLLILDEIQAAEGGLTALKYFCENMPQLHVVAAGSLLGIELHRHTSYPVGKVQQLTMYPMNFREFLLATGEDQLHSLLVNKHWDILSTFSPQIKERLKQYYFVGGMPEAVKTFISSLNFKSVRDVQNDILLSYSRDFSKHAPKEIVPRIKALWETIISQLAKENKKFIYGAIRSGARAKDYELAIQWLLDCGLCYQVFNSSTIQYPIKSVEERDIFKLFVLDVGLLAAMANIDISTFLNGNEIFIEFKGAFTEQYVCQQLISATEYGTPHYWRSKTGKAELDFIIQKDNYIVPIEVKAEENLQAKSLKVYISKFNPRLAIKTSMAPYKDNGSIINIPLYQISEI